MKIIIGIDVGGSTTKICGFRGTELLEPLFVKAADPVASVYGGFGKFTSQNGIALTDIERVMITGRRLGLHFFRNLRAEDRACQ